MRRVFTGIVLLGVLGLPAAVTAVDDPGLSLYEVTLPDPRIDREYDPVEERDLSLASPHWQQFQSGEGSGWLATMWSRETNLPEFAVGPGLDVGLSASPSSADVEAASRRFIAGHPELFGVDPGDLVLDRVNENGRKHQALFEQYVSGVPVVQAWVRLNYMDGLLVALGSEAYPDIDISTSPAIDGQAAARLARAGLPWNAETDGVRDGRLVVLPITWTDGATSYHLAHEMVVETSEPLAHWRTYVDAYDGEVLGRSNELPYGTFSGDVTGQVQPVRYTDPLVEVPFKELRVVIDGGQTVFTDDAGHYSGTGPDGSTTVTAEMLGSFVRVYEDDGGGYDEISMMTGPGNDIDFQFAPANTENSERNCFYHTNVVHDWIKNVDPGFTGTDYQMLCRVDMDGSCNAFWNGNAINFYDASGSCVNMAELPDVIYHEYQHGITQFVYSPSPSPTGSGMGEAFSDYTGMTIGDDPLIGEGINYGGGFIRTGENLRQYPATECGAEVHCKGEVLMGSLWKTREAFIAKYGHETGVAQLDELFHLAAEGKQYNIPAYLNQLLVEDDDNGNVADGTPNYYEFCDNFAKHNVPCPPITIYVDVVHTPLGDTPNTTNPYALTATVTSVGAGPIDPNEVNIFYSADGVNYSSTPMTLQGPGAGGDVYEGEIPAMGGGTVVDYYIRAETTDGVDGTHPPRAPDQGVNQFLVGDLSEKLGGGLESNAGWTELQDENVTDGWWEWGDPEEKIHPTEFELIQPGDDHTEGGVNCYVTRNLGGFWSNGDVDNGVVTLVTPAMDFTDASGGGYVEFWFFMVDWTTPNDSLKVEISDNNSDWIRVATIHSTNSTEYNDWNYRKYYFRGSDIDFSSGVNIRFVAEDAPDNSIHEVAIDDVVVMVHTGESSDVGDTGAPVAFRVDGNRPNPFNPRTAIRYQLPSRSQVKVEVYNVAGERVRTLVDGAQDAGVHNAVFDGRNENGNPLPSGLYFARVRAGTEESTITMTLLK